MWRSSDRENLTDCDYLDEDFAQLGDERIAASSTIAGELQLYDCPSTGGNQHLAPANEESHEAQSNLKSQSKFREKPGAFSYCFEHLTAIFHPNGEDSYLPWSIINSLCCCMVLGIIAVIFSVRSLNSNEKGRKGDAKTASVMAYTLNVLATMIGVSTYLTFYILYITTDIFDKEITSKSWFNR